MNEKREFSSHSLKNAILEAAHAFNTVEDNIKYEIITGKTKYFGHKKREIHINAWTSDGEERKTLSDFIEKIIKLLKFDLYFNIIEKKGFLKIDFKGDDYKLLLYKNGNLLNAIQYLLNRLFSDEIGKKMYCECEQFRKKREQELSTLANRYAREVMNKGKPINLEELNPFERRIVHLTINKYPNLESKSEGDGFLKIITIMKVNE